MKTHPGVLTLLAISMTILIVGASNSLVSAQTVSPCTATLSYPVLPVEYSSSSVPVVVPISASCTASYGSQLYVTGNAYDATANTGLGSASTVLTSVNGGEFNGQLGFNLPPTTQGESVQFSVSVYSSQDGNLLTTTSETVQVGTGVQQVQQVTTTTVTQDQYPSNYQTAPSQYQPNTSQYQNHQSDQTHHFSQALTQTSNSANLFDYVVIVAILAAVIIATAGLVLVARRQQQPTWYQAPLPR